jgi:hypothetical protein
MYRKRFLQCAVVSALVVAAVPAALSQQVECAITVNTEAVPTTNRDRVRDFADVLTSYVSNYSYGATEVEDKITCMMNVFFTSAAGNNKYSAQVFLGSQRPVYKSGQNTAMLRLMDDSWEFSYMRERPLDHNMYVFNDLTTFIDFYMMLVLGFDNDSYDELGGTQYFQKAADLSSLAAQSGQPGWQTTGSAYKRTRLVQEILSGRMEPVRRAIYRYHFRGLDSLAINRERAWENILGALEMIGRVRKTSDPQNLFIRSFFETKYQEIAGLFADYPDPGVYAKLIGIDMEHQQTYLEYMKKKE